MSAPAISGRWRAPARPPALTSHRALALGALLPLAATLLVHAASAADPVPAVRLLDAAAARRGGLAVELRAAGQPPTTVLEIRAADGSPYPGVLLDASPDGSLAAIAEARGLSAMDLTIARADGSQLRAEVDGLLAATLSQDGSRVAVVDGTGRLWTLDVLAGELRRLADGPFLAAPVVETDGTVLALSVPSVEAPFRSRLVRVLPDGDVLPLSEEELVYTVSGLADGSLAIVAHRPGGTVVQRVLGDRPTLHADLGPDAVNASISGDGDVIAWETAGQVFARIDAGPNRPLGAGSRPRVAPDGSALLVERDGHALLLDLDGNVIGRFAAASAFVDCGEECLP